MTGGSFLMCVYFSWMDFMELADGFCFLVVKFTGWRDATGLPTQTGGTLLAVGLFSEVSLKTCLGL